MDSRWQVRGSLKALFVLPLAGGMLSLLITAFYLMNYGFSFEFLGHEKGSERSGVNLWSVVNIVASLLLIAFSIDQLIRYNRISSRVLMGMLLFTGLIHAPPLLLWLMIGDDLFGVFVHAAAMLVLIGGLAGVFAAGIGNR